MKRAYQILSRRARLYIPCRKLTNYAGMEEQIGEIQAVRDLRFQYYLLRSPGKGKLDKLRIGSPSQIDIFFSALHTRIVSRTYLTWLALNGAVLPSFTARQSSVHVHQVGGKKNNDEKSSNWMPARMGCIEKSEWKIGTGRWSGFENELDSIWRCFNRGSPLILSLLKPFYIMTKILLNRVPRGRLPHERKTRGLFFFCCNRGPPRARRNHSDLISSLLASSATRLRPPFSFASRWKSFSISFLRYFYFIVVYINLISTLWRWVFSDQV